MPLRKWVRYAMPVDVRAVTGVTERDLSRRLCISSVAWRRRGGDSVRVGGYFTQVCPTPHPCHVTPDLVPAVCIRHGAVLTPAGTRRVSAPQLTPDL